MRQVMVERVLRAVFGGLQQLNRLTQIHFEVADELIGLLQFLARVAGVILDVEFGVAMAHIDRQRGAVFAARYAENVSDVVICLATL